MTGGKEDEEKLILGEQESEGENEKSQGLEKGRKRHETGLVFIENGKG